MLSAMSTCRVCGAECAPEEVRAVHEGGGCRRCNGSPACSRCGHARRHHRGAFGPGEQGCKARVAAEVGLAIGRCGCPAYTTDAAAFGEPVEIVETAELRLRRPGEVAPTDGLRIPPMRDLLDEGRRLRDLSDLDGLPWRPHE